MLGTAQLPVTGGLLLGDDVSTAAASSRFPISQDQRNTARAHLRLALTSRLWAGADSSYGSGLPLETDQSTAALLAQYPAAILRRINLDRGRIRPSASTTLSAGALLWQQEQKKMTLAADVANITDRLNVINFAGLFSGTAIDAPRRFDLRARFEW
jgi:hypothetical protein